MSIPTWAPPCVIHGEPQLEVSDGRRTVSATLAGYPLRPGRGYRVRVRIPGLTADQWNLRVSVLSDRIGTIELAPAGAEHHEARFRVPYWPSGFWISLTPQSGSADIQLAAEIAANHDPLRPVPVPLYLRPTLLPLLSVLVPVLLSLTGLLDWCGRWLAPRIEPALGKSLPPWFYSIAMGVLLWSMALVAYLWWKWRCQPGRRARRTLARVASSLPPPRSVA